MECSRPVGHDWKQLERRLGPDHLVLYICSKCLTNKRYDFTPNPLELVSVHQIDGRDQPDFLTCEEVQVWNIHKQ